MHLLITAGPTREYIDPVRFISNASSGKMGYALARSAKTKGHKVTLISTVDLQPPIGTEFVGVDTAGEMFAAVKKLLGKCDFLIMTAAVADYAPVKISKTKIKKTSENITIKLKPTEDILKWAGKNKKKHQAVVGFALEDKAVLKNAEKKLTEKNLDMIIANTPEAIGADKTTVHIKTAKGNWLKIEDKTKTTIARKIIKQIESLK